MQTTIKRTYNVNRLVQIEALTGMVFQAESGGHLFEISGIDNAGEAVALSGTVSGVFLRPDNTDVALTGSVSGGVVSVPLKAECYAVPGRFGLTLYISAGGSKTAIYAAMGTVSRTSSGQVAPTVTADVVDLVNRIATAVNSIPATYTDLQADIAPTYSDTAVYAVGQFAWYNGDLKRCKTAITTPETYTAAHWENGVLGNDLNADITGLKSALSNTNSAVGSMMQNTENISIPFTVTNGKYVSSTGGTGNSANAAITDYIDISAFSRIRYKLINVTGGSNWGTAFYNEEYEMIARKRYPYNAEAYSYVDELWETVIPENAKYARFTMLADTETYGDYEIYAVNGIPEELERLDTKIDDEIAGLDFIKSRIKIGKNLYNPETVSIGKYISNNTGSLSNNASYDTSDFIPVTAGNPIIISRLRFFLAYDDQRNPLSDTYISGTRYSYVFTPTVNGFIRASLFVEAADRNMISYGSTLPVYEPYKETVVVEEDIHLSDTMAEDVEAIVSATKGTGKKLTVVVDNDSYTLYSQYGADTKLKRTLSYGKRNNRTFEFDYAYIVDSNGAQTQIKESTDDITPLRLSANGSSRTVGANHGWVMIRVAVGDLTTADAGSVWTDGINEYILAMVDEAYAYFVLPATMTNDSYTYNTDAPTANLTHVNGATHTGEISIDGLEGGNLYPSVNNRKHKIYADGVEIIEDDTYYCDKFTVWEQYDIMDYVDIGEYLQSHIGTDLLVADEIAGCVRQTIQYTFGETDCVIAHGTEALKNIYYTDCGFLQAIPSTFTGKNFYRYGNGVNENSPLYSADLLNQTSDSSGFDITPSMLADPDVPMNRSIDLVKESNGSLAWGFTTGFIPDISYGANSYRKELSQFWSFRNGSRKSYPCTFRYRHADAGFYADILGYRNYLRPGLDITNETQIEVGDALYVIVDAHTQQTNRSVKVPDKYLGKSIQVLEPVNFALSSPVVGANGVVFSTTAAYGCAVLKITQSATVG